MSSARLLLFLLALLAAPAAVAEFVLELPIGARETYSRIETRLPARVPVGAAKDGEVPFVTAPGRIRRTVWRIGGEQTLQAVAGLIRQQLAERGYEILLDCVARACGGFDFRFGIDVVPEPVMQVDLRNFHFITAREPVLTDPGYVTFLVSRTPLGVFVQMTEYLPERTERAPVPIEPAPATAPDDGAAERPERIVLEGLRFAPGSAKLEAEPDGTLARLAEILEREPETRVVLVGHSDMSGELEPNLKLSQRRAEAVREILVERYGIDPARVSAHGVGYLAPRASNASAEGRELNRRVEALLLR